MQCLMEEVPSSYIEIDLFSSISKGLFTVIEWNGHCLNAAQSCD